MDVFQKVSSSRKVRVSDHKNGKTTEGRSSSKTGAKRPGRSSTRILRGMQRRQEQRGGKEITYLDPTKNRKNTRQIDAKRFTKPPRKSGWKGDMLVSSQFQLAMGLAIVLNAIVIGFETDTPDFALWGAVEVLFLLVFLAELVLRLVVFGPYIYFNPGNPDVIWNLFDAGIVFSGVVDTVGQSCHLIDSQASGEATLLRVFRLLRVIRIFRIIRFLKQLYMLVYGFGVAALATVWVTILALVMLYVCGIIAVRLARAVPRTDVDYEVLQDHFDKVGRSMVTLFELMLNPDISKFENLLGRYLLLTCFIVGFVIFGSFGMLALLTGVISEAMFDKNLMRQEEDRSEREMRREVLHRVCAELFDELIQTQKDSTKGHKHLVEVSKETALQQRQRMVEVFIRNGFHFTIYDLEDVFKHIDTDENGTISKPEFLTGIASISDGLQASTILELHQVISGSSVILQKRVNKIRDLLNARAFKYEQSMARIQRRCKLLEDVLNKHLRPFPTDDESKSISLSGNSGVGASEVASSSPPSEASYVNLRLAAKVDALETMVREMRDNLTILLIWLKRILPKNLAGKLKAGDSWTALDFQAPESAREVLNTTAVKTWLDTSQDLLVPTPQHFLGMSEKDTSQDLLVPTPQHSIEFTPSVEELMRQQLDEEVD